jgi:hypothetical protein
VGEQGRQQPFPQGFQKDFNTHYVDPQEGYKRISTSPRSIRTSRQVYDLPNKTHGYQRKSQAIVGTSTPYTGSTSAPDTTAARRRRSGQAVVLTTQAWGQDGGNDVTAELVEARGRVHAAERVGQRQARSR